MSPLKLVSAYKFLDCKLVSLTKSHSRMMGGHDLTVPRVAFHLRFTGRQPKINMAYATGSERIMNQRERTAHL